MPLLSLPPEIHLLIADNLPNADMARLARTSQRFYALINPILYSLVMEEDCGATPLFYAALKNSPTIAALLIDTYHVDPNLALTLPHPPPSEHLVTGQIHTALHIAAALNHTSVSQALLTHGASPNSVNHTGATPLHVSCLAGHFEMVQLLIAHSSDVNAIDELCTTPLHNASYCGYASLIPLLLAAGAAVNAIAMDPQNNVDSGYTPLHAAADYGHTEIIRLLLDAGANVEARIQHSEWTPLSCAAAEGFENTVAALLEYGASVNVWPENPLRLAVDGKWCDGVVEKLLDAGADAKKVLWDNAIGVTPERAARLRAFVREWRKRKEGTGETTGTGDKKTNTSKESTPTKVDVVSLENTPGPSETSYKMAAEQVDEDGLVLALELPPLPNSMALADSHGAGPLVVS